MSRTARIIAFLTLAILPVIAILFIDPIAQDLAYHNFADKRAFFAIANFNDVISNIPFLIFGLWGMSYTLKLHPIKDFTMIGEKPLWIIFFFAAFLVGIGSSYYHLDPNNQTLVWDRLPMTFAFMTFFCLMIMECLNPKTGLFLFPLFLLAGILSVVYWQYTESIGQGDLRFYALVQFLPLLLIGFMLWAFPRKYNGTQYLGYVLGCYILAKILEHFDKEIYTFFHGHVSGHSMKHIAAAFSIYAMLTYLQKRRTIKLH